MKIMSRNKRSETEHTYRWHYRLVVLAVLLSSVVLAEEPDFAATHQKRIDTNPPSVTFTVELAEGQKRFHVGELIPLDIVSQFDKVGDLLINDGLCRDCGTARLLEVFHVSPESGTRSMTRDKPDFHRSAGGTPIDVKRDSQYRYRVYVNEWRRFDAPGRYRFYSESARIWAPRVYPHRDNDVRVTSNVVEIEIVAAPVDWQIDQIRRAVEVLDAPAPGDKAKQPIHERRRLIELRRLRYLDTELATRTLARYETGRDDLESYETGMGLYQSRFKAAAVEELERRMASPDFAVTASFVRQLASLAADVRFPIDYSQHQETTESQARLARLEAERNELEQSMRAKYTDAARQATEKKNPLIRARSLLERLPTWPVDFRREPHPPTGGELDKIREAVAGQFEKLSAEEQASVLGMHWKRIGGIVFLPVLRRFIAAAPERQNDNDEYSLIDRALNRLWELDPDEGAALVLDELKRPKPRAELRTFRRILNRPDPELDQMLTGRVTANSDDVDDEDKVVAARMLAHLGSPAVYNKVAELYDENRDHWSEIPAALLAYLIRHNAAEGTRLLNRAIDEFQSEHFRSILSDIAEAQMSAPLEAFAIQRLDDPDPRNVEHAIWLLESHGSQKAEQPLWRRLENWHSTWKDRVAELKTDDTGNQRHPQIQLEFALAHALSTGTAWFTDANGLRRVRRLCLTESTQHDVDRMIDNWREPIAIRLFPGTNGDFPSAVIGFGSLPLSNPNDNWNVAQYTASSLTDLKLLLGRFPAGMTFSYPVDTLTDEAAEQALFEDLQTSLAAHVCKLVKATAQ